MDSLLDLAPCGLLTLADDGAIRLVNRTLLRLLGYAGDDLLGQHINLLLPPAGRIFYQTHLFPLLCLHGHADELYLVLRARDGRDIPVFLNAARRAEAGGAVYDWAMLPMFQRERYEAELLRARKTAEDALRDRERAVAELQRAHADLAARQADLERLNRRLVDLASLDPLTGLKNRRAFQERLAAELAAALRLGDPLSLLLADIDFFKAINDSYTHIVGDAVLRQVGQTLLGSVRASDLVARFGGEEFALLLPRTDRGGAVELAERLRAAVAASCPEDIPVTISVGVATLGEACATELDLLLAADQAMYRSKARGRNAVSHADDPAGPAPAR